MTEIEQHLSDRLEHLAWYVDRIKNGMTVHIEQNVALTRIFTGQKMYVDTRDRSLAPHIMLDGFWELEFSKFFQNLINPESIVLDVGANFGYFSLIAGTKVQSGSIHSFEANPLMCHYMDLNRDVNGMRGRMHIHNNIVSDQDGMGTLTRIKNYMGDSLVNPQKVKDFQTIEDQIEVKKLSLDQFVKENNLERIDIVKMDIEGSEYKALLGMEQTIANQGDNLILLMEYAPFFYDTQELEMLVKFLKARFKFHHFLSDQGHLKPLWSFHFEGWKMLVLSNFIIE